MPYIHFQYIAYQIPTVARTAAEQKIYGIPPSNPITAPPALTPALQGNVAGLGDDAQRRIERLIGAMLVAANKLQSSKDNNQTLKIFMAPEFYFRPANDEVSYTYEQYQAIKDVLRKTIAEDDRFKHWLVIPGTIIWKLGKNQSLTKRPQPSLSLFDEDKQSFVEVASDVYFNSAIYVSRATFDPSLDLDKDNKPYKPSKVIEKSEVSDIDGIPSEKASTVMWERTNEEWGEGSWPKYLTPPKRAKHIFTTGGITFGLEICLEHNPYIRIVKQVVTTIPPEKDIKLHLLIAAGMPVMPVSVATITGGYILRTDGYNTKAGQTSTNCQKIEGYADSKSQKDWNSKAQLTNDTPVEATLDIKAEHPYLYIPNPPSGDAGFWDDPIRQQQIKIYQRQLLP